MTAASTVLRSHAPTGPPGGAFIAGQWQTTDLTLPVLDPENEQHVGSVACSSGADIDRAVAALRHGLGQEWPLHRRRAALTDASTRLAVQADRFARLIATEGCKTIVEAEREVARAVETLRLSGECADALTGETLPLENTERGAGRIGWFVRAPVGIVAAITPFNDPLNLVAHKLGPALLAGNGVILKPHEATPLTALALVEVLLAAGVPRDRLAVVCGEAETGHHLVTHPEVDLVSFTGGLRTATRISAIAGPRRLLMELGGNNPTLVCADADPAAAAAAIVQGAFGTAGQNCLSVQRVYIASTLFDEVAAAVVSGTRDLVVGSKQSRHTDVGPMISTSEARRVQEWVQEAVAQGARVLAGGTTERQLPRPDRARRRAGRGPDRGRGGVRARRLPLLRHHDRGGDPPRERTGARAARGHLHPRHRRRHPDQRAARRRRGARQRHQRLPHRRHAVRRVRPLRHRQGRHHARSRGR